MKKLLFALPFLLFSVTGCSSKPTIGSASKITIKDIVSLSLEGNGLETNYQDVKYDIPEEYKAKIVKEILNLKVEILESHCRCISEYHFNLVTEQATYYVDEYGLAGEDKEIFYAADHDSYQSIVNYVLETFA